MTTVELTLKMILDRWNASIAQLNKHLGEISDEQLMLEVAPNKNRGIYIFGHLIAAHDNVITLLDLGEKLYPELNEPFLINADKVSTVLPSVETLRNYWANQCEVLQSKIASISTEQWFEKHTAVSAEEFVNEPHRNKLNILLTRTTHLQYHIGQLVLLK